MGITDAKSMEYNFETLTAEVIYPAGSKIRVPELTAYFEEASDFKVQMIKVTSGDIKITLAKNDQGKWTTIAEG